MVDPTPPPTSPPDPRITLAPPPGPEAMRSAMAGYVRGVHRAYLDAAALLPPAERARLPLLAAGRLTVAAVGTANLHVLGTTEALPAPVGAEVELAEDLDGLAWSLRFFDPVVLPGLGLVDESTAPQPAEVRRLLGVRTYVYHLVVPPGGQLTGHHAGHAGTGLAHAHAAAARDLEAIRAHARGREDLVDELAGATVAGLPRAQALLAMAIAPTDLAVRDLASVAHPDADALRRALLAAVRPTAPAPTPQPAPTQRQEGT